MASIEHPYIEVPHGMTVRIAKDLNVSRTMVSLSLNFKINGSLAEKIREAAITEYGGYRVNPITRQGYR